LPSDKNPGTSLNQQFRVLNQYSLAKRIRAIKYLGLSRAQLAQDLFIMLELNYKTGGFFVEFGASDGVTLSNSYLLEKSFNWRGILAEPARMWHEALSNSRTTHFCKKAVWGKSGEILEFEEYDLGELNTLKVSKHNDGNSKFRNANNLYNVETISLRDLLSTYHAPTNIDAIIIDTEGSEYEILKSFDLFEYQIKIFIIEHAYSTAAHLIDEILVKNGYERVHSRISQWDYWYINRQLSEGI
jgi:FkbM family methyltransferase